MRKLPPCTNTEPVPYFYYVREAKMDEERREHQLAMESKEAELVEALRIQHERSQELVQLYKLHAEIEVEDVRLLVCLILSGT